jgi:hypothetical protein
VRMLLQRGASVNLQRAPAAAPLRDTTHHLPFEG